MNALLWPITEGVSSLITILALDSGSISVQRTNRSSGNSHVAMWVDTEALRRKKEILNSIEPRKDMSSKRESFTNHVAFKRL